MLEALRQGGSWHMVGYHKRSDPASMFARGEIDRLKQTGEVGRLRYVRITMPPGDWVGDGFFDHVKTDEPYPPGQPDPTASDMDDATLKAYGSFVNYYIHQVNLLRYLLGEPYRVTFADRAGVLLVGESSGGITCSIEMQPFTTTRDWQESALVAFERGWVRLELPCPLVINQPGRVTVFLDPGDGATPCARTPVLPPVSAMRQQAANFIRAIRGEIRPPCEAAEALEDLVIAREYIRLWKGA